MGSFGTWTLLLQGQWSSLTALGLALAYRDWRHGHEARGAVILVLAAGVAKPHLALGLAAFLIGWRRRRVILGAITGLAALAVTSVAVVGTAGVVAFAGLATAQGGAWDLGRMLSFIAIPGSIAGNGTASEVIGLCGTAVACAIAWALGDLARRHPGRFDRALIAAAVLSLLGAPHAYAQDLVMLAPVLIWAIALADERRLAVIGIWTVISCRGGRRSHRPRRVPARSAGGLDAHRCRGDCLPRGLATRTAHPRAWRPDRHATDGGGGRLTSSREAALGTLANGVRFERTQFLGLSLLSLRCRPRKKPRSIPWSWIATSSPSPC